MFRKEGASTQVLPFYWSRRGNPGHRVVAPLYFHFWSPTGRTHIFAPFYFHFEDHTARRTVNVVWAGLPISWTRQPGASSFGLWPLYYTSTRFGWAAPLIGSFRVKDPAAGRAFGLYGFLYYNSRDDRRARAFDLLFPLLVSSRSKTSSLTWVFPLNFYWRDSKNRNLLVLPLFYRRADESGSVWAWPLGYHSRAAGSTRGALFWLYWYGRAPDGTAHDVFFPLVWSFRAPNRATTVVGPFLTLRRPTWSFTTLLPLYFRGHDVEKRSTFSLLLPFYFSHSADGGARGTWLTPFGTHSVDAKTTSWRLTFWLPPILAWRDRERRFDAWVGLYWRWQDRARATDTLLAGIFYRARDPEGTTTTLFPFYWRFSDHRNQATATLLMPFYFRRSNPEARTFAAGIFPLWFFRSDEGPRGRSAGFFPLVFYGREGARGHTFVLPLFFHTRDAHSSFTLVTPLFYHHRNRSTSGTGPSHATGILPLLYFQGADRTGSYRVQSLFSSASRTLPHVPRRPSSLPFFGTRAPGVIPPAWYPLWFAGRDDETRRRHFVLFPLFFLFSDDQRDRHTMVLGPYWRRQHGNESTHALFPLFYYRRGARPDGQDETSLTLLPFFHYGRTPNRTLLRACSRLVTHGRAYGGLRLPLFLVSHPDARCTRNPADLAGPYSPPRTRAHAYLRPLYCRRSTRTARALLAAFLRSLQQHQRVGALGLAQLLPPAPHGRLCSRHFVPALLALPLAGTQHSPGWSLLLSHNPREQDNRLGPTFSLHARSRAQPVTDPDLLHSPRLQDVHQDPPGRVTLLSSTFAHAFTHDTVSAVVLWT